MLREQFKLAARWTLWLVLTWLVFRGAVSVVAPPRPLPAQSPAPSVTSSPSEAPALGVHAVLFARDYLTWQRAKAEDYAQRLRSWLPDGIRPEIAMDLHAVQKDQSVRGAWVYRTVPAGENRSLVTVLAEVITADGVTPEDSRLILLAVPMIQTPNGPAVADLPAFLPPPEAVSGDVQERGADQPDENGEVLSLVQAFFKAYADGSDIRFFMASGTKVPGFAPGSIALERVPELHIWKQNQSTLATADVVWKDLHSGAEFRQRYCLELVQRDRWLIKQLLVGRGLLE